MAGNLKICAGGSSRTVPNQTVPSYERQQGLLQNDKKILKCSFTSGSQRKKCPTLKQSRANRQDLTNKPKQGLKQLKAKAKETKAMGEKRNR